MYVWPRRTSKVAQSVQSQGFAMYNVARALGDALGMQWPAALDDRVLVSSNRSGRATSRASYNLETIAYL